jgi:prepilin-type processing-associated H-X9-DG protein
MTQANNPMEQIKCPHCGQTYAVRPDQWEQYSGRTINCTRCGWAFTVEARHVIPQTAAPAPAYGQPPAYVPAGANAMMPQQPVYGGMPYPIQPTTTSGFAVWSLVCGLLSFCVPVIGNLLAIVFGIIGIVKTGTPQVRGRGMAITGLILGIVALPVVGLLFFMLGAMTPALSNAREAANRVKCTANMNQLGQAMLVYANANKGEFPDKLEDLLTSDPTIDRNVFICPDDDKTAPSGSVQMAAQGIASGKNCSYIYVGSGVTASDPADTVLLYEPLSLHHQYQPGMNVLFADGHVAALNKSDGQAIVDQQAAGTRPIKSSAGP